MELHTLTLAVLMCSCYHLGQHMINFKFTGSNLNSHKVEPSHLTQVWLCEITESVPFALVYSVCLDQLKYMYTALEVPLICPT